MSQGGILGETGVIPPEIATTYNANSGSAVPIANVLEILGEVIAADSNPFRTIASGNTVTAQVQISQAIASTDATKLGLAAFSSAHFNVDANGFVTLDNPFVGLTITGDTGGPISPSGNNWNLLGQGTPLTSGIQINGSNSTLSARMISPYTLSNFSFENPSGTVAKYQLQAINRDTNATSGCEVRSGVTGASSADAWLQVGVNAVMNYCWGIDNSDSQTLKICADANGNSATPSGGTVLYKLTSSGAASYVNGNFDVTRSAVGSSVIITAENTDAANTSSNSIVRAIAQAGGGDPVLRSQITGGTSWSLGGDNSDSDSFVISQGLVLGTKNIMRASTAGEINYPLQPAFLATTGGTSDVTGDGTTATISFTTEIFDQNNDYDGSTTFTAPVTGRYLLSVFLNANQYDAAHTSSIFTIVTSNRNYRGAQFNAANVMSSANGAGFSHTALCDMDAGDTATVQFIVTGGTKVVDVISTSSFRGYLAC